MGRVRALALSTLGAMGVLTIYGCFVALVGAGMRRPGLDCGYYRPARPPIPGFPPAFSSAVGNPPSVCGAAVRRTEFGDLLEILGVGAAIVGVLVIVGMLTREVRDRRHLLAREAGQPVAAQSRSHGVLLTAVGMPLSVFGGGIALILGALALRYRDLSPLWHLGDGAYATKYGFVLFGAGALALFGRAVGRRGRHHIAASAAELMAEDPRPPVLYLRSFVDDRRMAADSPTDWWAFLLPVTPTEDELVVALGDIGPVVALGKPGERLPPIGAARAYANNASWKEQIAEWAQNARLIVMLAGSTPSFWEEVKHVHDTRALSKTCILVPRDPEQYERFRAGFLKHTTGVLLPYSLPGASRSGFYIGGLLWFSSNGHAQFIPIPPKGPESRVEWRKILRGLGALATRTQSKPAPATQETSSPKAQRRRAPTTHRKPAPKQSGGAATFWTPRSGPDPVRGRDLIAQHGGLRSALTQTHPDHGGSARDFIDVVAARDDGAT